MGSCACPVQSNELASDGISKIAVTIKIVLPKFVFEPEVGVDSEEQGRLARRCVSKIGGSWNRSGKLSPRWFKDITSTPHIHTLRESKQCLVECAITVILCVCHETPKPLDTVRTTTRLLQYGHLWTRDTVKVCHTQSCFEAKRPLLSSRLM